VDEVGGVFDEVAGKSARCEKDVCAPEVGESEVGELFSASDEEGVGLSRLPPTPTIPVTRVTPSSGTIVQPTSVRARQEVLSIAGSAGG
jgi:hypothetical protein